MQYIIHMHIFKVNEKNAKNTLKIAKYLNRN